MIESTPFAREQQRHLLEVQQVWTKRIPLLAQSQELVGGMQWKTIRGRDYLYRYGPDPVTKKKRSTSLGPKGPETEALHARFFERRTVVREELRVLEETAAMQARVSKALRLDRAPRPFARALNAIAESGLQEHMALVSEQASWGYETLFMASLPDLETKEMTFVTLDDSLVDDLVRIAQDVWPDAASWSDGRVRTFSFDGLKINFSTQRAFLKTLQLCADDDEQVRCIKDRLAHPPIATFTIDRSGYPVSMSVSDPIGFAMISSIAHRDEPTLGLAIIELAVDSGQYELEEHERDAFPRIVKGMDLLGPRI